MKNKQILAVIDARYSLARAEKWDKTGLQIGDANGDSDSVFVAHEITSAVVAQAPESSCVVVYHPLIFGALENLDFANHTARLAGECMRKNLTVIVAHTALDNASPPDALGDALAREIALHSVEVLAASGREELLKLVVFVPEESSSNVAEALWNAGAGAIGNYDRASFRTSGEGTFRPLAGANPRVGEIGRDETVREMRLEVLVPAAKLSAVLGAMNEAHPYETVAHEIYPIQNQGARWGSARVGEISATLLDVYAETVRRNLGAPNVRLVRAGKHVSRIACCPGSGASFLSSAARAGANCLVTGDIKHHDALKAQALGISIIDVTHVATERSAVSLLLGCFDKLPIETKRSGVDTNPFAALH